MRFCCGVCRSTIIVLRLIPLVVLDVRHAGGMRDHLAHGDGLVAVIGETELRQVLHDQGVEIDFAHLDQLHNRRGHERLCNGRHMNKERGVTGSWLWARFFEPKPWA